MGRDEHRFASSVSSKKSERVKQLPAVLGIAPVPRVFFLHRRQNRSPGLDAWLWLIGLDITAGKRDRCTRDNGSNLSIHVDTLSLALHRSSQTPVIRPPGHERSLADRETPHNDTVSDKKWSLGGRLLFS